MKNRNSKVFKIVLVIILVIAIIGVAGLAYGGNYLYNYALSPNAEKTILSDDSDSLETSGIAKNTDQSWMISNAKDVLVESDDGLSLHAYELNTKSDTYAIVVHGYRSEALGMATYVKHFYDLGINVIAPDLRGHGKSEGDYVGMGWPDRLDILNWIQVILKENKDAKIVLMGVSMGAATVMMASGEELPEQVKCIVEDCGYTSVWEEFKLQLKNEFNLPSFPVLNVASSIAKMKAGYDFREASAINQVKKSVTPMLFIHGDADTFVPYSMLDPLYNAANSEKEKLVIKGAEHAMAAVVDPKIYWSTVEKFVSKYVNQ